MLDKFTIFHTILIALLVMLMMFAIDPWLRSSEPIYIHQGDKDYDYVISRAKTAGNAKKHRQSLESEGRHNLIMEMRDSFDEMNNCLLELDPDKMVPYPNDLKSSTQELQVLMDMNIHLFQTLAEATEEELSRSPGLVNLLDHTGYIGTETDSCSPPCSFSYPTETPLDLDPTPENDPVFQLPIEAFLPVLPVIELIEEPAPILPAPDLIIIEPVGAIEPLEPVIQVPDVIPVPVVLPALVINQPVIPAPVVVLPQPQPAYIQFPGESQTVLGAKSLHKLEPYKDYSGYSTKQVNAVLNTQGQMNSHKAEYLARHPKHIGRAVRKMF